jgi:hypothetical protein
MKRLGPFLILSLLTACTELSPRPPSDTRDTGIPDTGIPDTGIPDTGIPDTGIPDTGIPTTGAQPAVGSSHSALPARGASAGQFAPDGPPVVTAPLIAERGIGGTGAPVAASPASRTADRGIGGTGIVGVVTAFGSVFVNGIEVQYDDSAVVDIDGTQSSVSALRVGQWVGIQAEGPASAPFARTISVRSAVTGRIEALQPDSRTLTVAGQVVFAPAGIWGANRSGSGDWVKVSGLRRADGTIVATRLDATPAGVLLVRGQVARDGGVTRVGNLALSAPLAACMEEGQLVVVSGAYTAGVGHVNTCGPDTLFSDPGEFFGPATNRLIVQAFVESNNGSLFMNGVKVRTKPGVARQTHRDGIATVSLERDPAGSYVVVGLRYADTTGLAGQPFRKATGAGEGNSSQVLQPNGYPAAVLSKPTDSTGRNAAADGTGATTSIGRDPSPTNGSAGSAPGLSSAEAPATIIHSAAMRPAAPAASPVTTPTGPTLSGPTPSVSRMGPPVTRPIEIVPDPGTPLPADVPAAQGPGSSTHPPSTSQLISDIGSHGATTVKPRTHAVVAQRGANHAGPATPRNLASTRTIDLLTGAVTSVTTTGAGTSPSRGSAATSAVPSSTSTQGKSTTKAGTAIDTPSTPGENQPIKP